MVSPFCLSDAIIHSIKYASRMSTQVDNVVIQAGYPLYHHVFFITENGAWAVIQQGMNTSDRTARRYHWLSKHVCDLILEPHDAIVGHVVRDRVLNMATQESEYCRRLPTDLFYL